MVGRILKKRSGIVRLRTEHSRCDAKVNRVVSSLMGIDGVVAMIAHIANAGNSYSNRARQQRNQLRIDVQRTLINFHQAVRVLVEKTFPLTPLLQRLNRTLESL